MKIFGTTTSPFVRRVRVVAFELGVAIDRVDTATPEGLAELERVSPIRKVPVAEIDGTPVFDSREIIRRLGWPATDPREPNLVNAIDAALDSIIQLFYLRRDGIAIDGTPYATRQLARTDAIFAWLGTQVRGDSFTGGFGLAEISLVCALDWMEFRRTYPTERAPAVEPVRAAWRERESLATTRPHA
jgi:glutathione S-transferase